MDRFALTDGIAGPASAEASELLAGSVGQHPSEAMSRPIPRVAFPAVGALEDGKLSRDFFSRADVAASSRSSESIEGSLRGDRLLRVSFEASATLGGVMVTEGAGVAVVNGARLVPGDSILVCTLQKVLGRSAHFQCSDGEAVLFIAPRGSGS